MLTSTIENPILDVDICKFELYSHYPHP